jgi:hypothetical protein
VELPPRWLLAQAESHRAITRTVGPGPFVTTVRAVIGLRATGARRVQRAKVVGDLQRTGTDRVMTPHLDW